MGDGFPRLAVDAKDPLEAMLPRVRAFQPEVLLGVELPPTLAYTCVEQMF